MAVGKNGKLSMVKHLLNVLFIFLMLSSITFAKNPDEKIQEEYGVTLTQVPFFLRFDYYQKHHKDWKETYYDDRKYFLLAYDATVAAEKKKAKEEAKLEAAEEKRRIQEKKDIDRKIKDRLKKEADEEKAEEKENEDRQKAFDDAIKAQQQAIQQMNQALKP
jgi:hypothetical protein